MAYGPPQHQHVGPNITDDGDHVLPDYGPGEEDNLHMTAAQSIERPGEARDEGVEHVPPPPRIEWLGFTVNPDPTEKTEWAVHDMVAGCREWCTWPREKEHPVNRDMRIMEAEVLDGREWKLTLIGDLPKRMGYADEDEEDAEADSYPQEEGDGHGNGLEMGASENVETEERDVRASFNWKAFHGSAANAVRIPSSSPVDAEHAADAAVDAVEDERMEVNEKPKVHGLPTTIPVTPILVKAELSERPMPPPAASRTFSLTERARPGKNADGQYFHPDDPRRNDLQYGPPKGPSNKRRRSEMGEPLRPSRRPVCRSCWQNGMWCTSDGRCTPCIELRTNFVYVRCRSGLSCRVPQCVYFYPGQLADHAREGDWAVANKTELDVRNSVR